MPIEAILHRLTKTVSGITFRFRGEHLMARCARGSLVLSIGAITAKGTAFVSKIILTRLLLPEALGLMVVVLSLTALFEALTQVGIRQSVIQNKNGAKSEYLNTAWWFQCLRGIGLYIIAFLATPWLCSFYFESKPEILALHSMPELLTLVRVAFLVIPLNGFCSIKTAILEKDLRFGKFVLLIQGSSIFGTVLTIALIFVMRNVWALVIGFICTAMVRCLFSFILCPFRPRLSFDWESFHSLSRFAHGIFGLPILTYIAFNIDVLVAGKLIAGDLLGMYGMALALAQIPRQLYSLAVKPILLPAYSKKQDNKPALCKGVLRITKVTTLLTIPLVTLAVICSRTILSFVYGQQFSAVAVPFGLLCVYVLLLMEGSVLGNVLFGIGQPGKHRAFVGLRTLILVIFMYPAIKMFGLTGAAAVVCFASFVALCLQVAVLHKVIGLRVYGYAISWLPGFMMSLVILSIVWFLKFLSPTMHYLHLVYGLLSCVGASFATLLFMKHFQI